MKNLKISFEIKNMPLRSVAERGGEDSFVIEASSGVLSVFVKYDVDPRPLVLRGSVAVGDTVEAILMPHRIELYVNGKLCDEEWPAGECLFKSEDAFEPNIGITFAEYEEKRESQPDVLYTFENAEGWRPEGTFVGDCMPYVKGGEYHVLYLKDRRHHCSKWGYGGHQWEHISTKDFKVWSVHPTAVPITDPTEWSICTGSWFGYGEREYLFYSVRRGHGVASPILRSVSTDGYHFEKDRDFGFVISERYNRVSARDPKLLRGEDGLFHMLLTTKLVEEERGCLAHYVSADLDSWRDSGEPIYIAKDNTSPECPDYFFFGGRYYLVYSLGGVAHYSFSDRPFDGFVEPEDSVIPCGVVPKCAIWGDRMIFTGFVKEEGAGYAGRMTFKAATARPDGTLAFEDV